MRTRLPDTCTKCPASWHRYATSMCSVAHLKSGVRLRACNHLPCSLLLLGWYHAVTVLVSPVLMPMHAAAHVIHGQDAVISQAMQNIRRRRQSCLQPNLTSALGHCKAALLKASLTCGSSQKMCSVAMSTASRCHSCSCSTGISRVVAAPSMFCLRKDHDGASRLSHSGSSARMWSGARPFPAETRVSNFDAESGSYPWSRHSR